MSRSPGTLPCLGKCRHWKAESETMKVGDQLGEEMCTCCGMRPSLPVRFDEERQYLCEVCVVNMVFVPGRGMETRARGPESRNRKPRKEEGRNLEAPASNRLAFASPYIEWFQIVDSTEVTSRARRGLPRLEARASGDARRAPQPVKDQRPGPAACRDFIDPSDEIPTTRFSVGISWVPAEDLGTKPSANPRVASTMIGMS